MRSNIFRVKVFQQAEAAVVIHLRLRIAVLVQHHHRRNTGSGGDLLVVGTECRGNVYDTCRAFVRGNIVSRNYPERIAFQRFEPWNQLMVSDAHEVRALECTVKDFERNEFVTRLVVFELELGSLRTEPF